MRFQEHNPINEKEKAIEELLIAAGLDPNEMKFDYSYGLKQERYFRYRYWQRVEVPGFKSLVSENCIWDDDCGNLFCYSIKE